MTASHDLIVLGAGSGGLATAIRAAQHGVRVALLDPAGLGGTCVHRGCVPKKALWFAAQLAQAQQLALEFGFASQPGPLDWERFRGVRQGYIDVIEQRYAARLQEAGVQLLRQSGRFVAADTIELSDGDRLQAAQIVISTGARPRRLELPGFELGMVSDDIFALRALPRRVAIVGGGYVAVEFAGLLRALGAEVDMLAHGSWLQDFDAELVQALQQQMEVQGIRISLQSVVRAAHRNADGIMLDDSQTGLRGPYDALLWAVGRVPNTEALGLETVGVETDKRGHVLVDARQNTNITGILAVGDVTEHKALTPVAVAAGRLLADRLFGGQPDAQMDYRNIPSVLFAEPPLGIVGLTEAQARAEHGDQVTVYRSRFTPMQWKLAGRHDQTLMKLVCVGADERVVGIHALGPGVEEMLQGFAVALKLGLHKRDLDATVAIHPSSAEELVLMG
ncbi:glutathione-disulfide reductase [Rhodanobacter sp. MP7CTX1]|uniref:glutathione-disulfide reductase n=1 Tax=Rhodanobacter sp. MP7CTX1 TaxID=2723084 RepID=UPI00161A85BC|nr:glutathione-disulfide reductase [Rhodanobacter sp. MP7CTX1]MBB6188762.1 glutathione reductase (NADPH) [Rhodanobacter sp. MP7CTX1]